LFLYGESQKFGIKVVLFNVDCDAFVFLDMLCIWQPEILYCSAFERSTRPDSGPVCSPSENST
jgi:hypothetical protein